MNRQHLFANKSRGGLDIGSLGSNNQSNIQLSDPTDQHQIAIAPMRDFESSTTNIKHHQQCYGED